MKVSIIVILVAVMAVPISTAFAQDLPQNDTIDKKYQKMDSRLAALYDATSSGNVPIALANTLTLSQDEQRVQVILIMSDVDAEIPQDLGIVVETTYENMVQVNIPIANLEAVSSDSNVLFVNVPARLVPSEMNKSESPIPLAHVTSEGVNKIQSKILNNAGYTGQGIKIAVIDTGFDINNQEIKNNIKDHQSFRADRDITGGDVDNMKHGTGVSEIILDIAPNADLYLYNAATPLEFINLTEHLKRNNIDIDMVSMSAGWNNIVGPADGRSLIASKVNEVRDKGILWINAAGNEAQQHWQGTFYDSDNDGWHNFNGDNEVIPFDLRGGIEFKAVLSWDDWISTSQDYDFYLVNSDGHPVKIEDLDNTQPGVGPLEVMVYTPETNQNLGLAIKKFSATRNVDFQLFVSPYDMTVGYRVEASSLTIPADARGAMAVAATHWNTDDRESYSSQGPTLDGRTKPDISAPSVVTTTAYGTEKFDGTSAAAPHVSGAAALIMDKYSDLNPKPTANDVQNLLEATVKYRHAKSNQDGTGRVDLGMFVNSDILALDNSNSACASDNSCFFPKTLRVSRGDTVTWTNADNFPITITGNSGNSNFNSGQIFRGGNYSHTFTTDGTFSYSDGLHSWATGRIIVGSGVASSPPTFSSATYNQSSGVLTITFSKTIDKQRLNLSGLDIRESGYSSGGADLADARIQSTVNSATLTLTLTNADRTAVNSMTSPQLDISSGAVRDLDGNMIIAASDRPITITGSADTTPPTFVSATYNRNTGILATTFSELISKDNLNLSNLDIRESGQFSGGVDLADAIMQTSTNTSTLTLTLTASDRNSVNAMRTPQLDITAGAVRDVAGNSIFTTSDRPITVTGSSGNDGDLRSMIAELRSMINTINSKLTSLESSVNSLTARVAALESGGGTPPPPEPMTGVKGKIYTDTNNNNRLDPGERGRAGIEVITVNLANHSDVQRMRTDANGDFTFERNAGGYLLQAIGGGPNSYAYITIPNNTMLVQNLAY